MALCDIIFLALPDECVDRVLKRFPHDFQLYHTRPWKNR
jgi:hypothetical protein